MERTRIIGIDVATSPSKVGLALAEYSECEAFVSDVVLCSGANPPTTVVSRWIAEAPSRVLLAIDAPLGWPVDLGSALSVHRAGQPICVAPGTLFRRGTDRAVQRRVGKTPLDVGADRIARTAHSALALLGALRETAGPVELAWDRDFCGVAAIEVYPAATLTARRWPSTRYKKPEQRAERQEIFSRMCRAITVACEDACLLECADALDAAVCVLAGVDFLECRAVPPADQDLARKEGWIWVADPDRDGATAAL